MRLARFLTTQWIIFAKFAPTAWNSYDRMTHRHMLWQTFAAHKWRRKEPLSQHGSMPRTKYTRHVYRKIRPRQRVTTGAIYATRTLGKPSKRLKQLRRQIYPRGPNYPVTLGILRACSDCAHLLTTSRKCLPTHSRLSLQGFSHWSFAWFLVTVVVASEGICHYQLPCFPSSLRGLVSHYWLLHTVRRFEVHSSWLHFAG